jgi:putative heme-binding domain-containing protein
MPFNPCLPVTFVGILCLASTAMAQSVVIDDSPAATATDQRPMGNEAEWIWSPAHEKDAVVPGDVYFRKSFAAAPVKRAEIHIAADNAYELFVNGKPIGKGGDWRAMDVFVLTEHLRPGQNTIAVKATNLDAGAAGLVARVLVQHTDDSYAGHSTDASWRTSVKEFVDWQQPNFRDAEWLPAKSYGPLGDVLPWGNEVVLAGMQRRFRVVDEQFAVERTLTEDQTGSLIAMCFDHRGDVIAAREGGPLVVFRDLDRDGRHEAVATFCDQVKNVQGILPVGAQTLAVGEGPEGGGLYALSDSNSDGRIDNVKALLRFDGSTGEHGPHAVRLGPDGYIYVMIGNFARVLGQETGAAASRPQTAATANALRTAPPAAAGQATSGKGHAIAATSPYRDYYEGDLVTPRYEDPRGHAVGVKAPGATIIRTDSQGSFVEIVAGGLRNPYDFAFAADGEIFTYDADMEWDIGAPWYRPTRIIHATAGAEFGWRSGWAKWPDYYVDSLPGALDMGPGSPTGVEIYDHFVFPDKYRGAIFAADWARGRINAVFVKNAGATYAATSEVFVEGTPLNVTDLAVGPDGALYFCTGGRGTEGGLYRVRYTGAVPPAKSQLGQGITRALRQPQFHAPWAQAQIAAVKRELGAQWGPQLEQTAKNSTLDGALSVRAIDLLQLYGPRPAATLLVQLCQDAAPAVRARAAFLLGAHSEAADEQSLSRLTALLSDPSPQVRRVALEAVARRNAPAPVATLVTLLADDDRFVRFAARRALERQPAHSWRDAILAHASTRVFIEGSTALLAAAPDADVAAAITARVTKMLSGEVNDPRYQKGFINDTDFVDLLRVTQLALLRTRESTSSPLPLDGRERNRSPLPLDGGGAGGGGDPNTGIKGLQAALGQALVREYPTANPTMNREIVRLLAYLQVAEAAPLFAVQLESADVPPLEKLHIAAYAPRLKQGWTTQHKIALIRYYDAARNFDGGYSLSGYIENFARDFYTSFSIDEKRQIIRAGSDWPSSALSVLATLPPQPGSDVLADVRQLDQQLADKPGDPIARLRVGIIAVLARSGDPASLGYLRELYQNDPDRRPVVAMALTQSPGGDNWPILVDSIRIVEGPVATEVLTALASVQQKPSEAPPFRDAIVLGLTSEPETAAAAVRLLAHWGARPATGNPAADLRNLQAWYASRFPTDPPADPPKDSGRNKWSYSELSSFLESEEGKAGDPRRGLAVYQRAQCANCHRCGGTAAVTEGIGPDLTTLARRFHTKEILEAIVYPSHVISDQYASKLVQAGGRTYNGLVVPDGADAIAVVTSDGRKLRIAKTDVEDIRESRVSVMPENLLNILTLQDVADLFAFLRNETRLAQGGSSSGPNFGR